MNLAISAGPSYVGKFVVSRAGGVYDALDRGPNRLCCNQEPNERGQME